MSDEITWPETMLKIDRASAAKPVGTEVTYCDAAGWCGTYRVMSCEVEGNASQMNLERIRTFQNDDPSGCPYCNGTGDVHRADGEWLGHCHCLQTTQARTDTVAVSREGQG